MRLTLHFSDSFSKTYAIVNHQFLLFDGFDPGKQSNVMKQIHGTCLAIGGAGVILRGPPCSGKSDLALRLISEGHALVADDQVIVNTRKDRLYASAPKNLAGLIEVRGLGIFSYGYQKEVKIVIIVDLVKKNEVLRLPKPLTAEIAGITVPRVLLFPFEASAHIKLVLAVKAAHEKKTLL